MIEPEDVVVDMDSVTHDVIRVGRIVASETPARPSVMWRADSEPEAIRVGGALRRVPYGGLRYLALVAPELLDGLLESRPADMFVRALHAEHGDGKADARRLKSVLTECGLDSARVDRAWSTVSKSFADQPGVRPTGERGYRPDRSFVLPDLGPPHRRESFREGDAPQHRAEESPDPDEATAFERSIPQDTGPLAEESADRKRRTKPTADDLRSAMSSDPTEDDLDAAARAKPAPGVQDSDAFRQWISSPAAVQRHVRAVSRPLEDNEVAGIIRFTESLLEANRDFVLSVHGVAAISSIKSENPSEATVSAGTRFVDALANSVRKTDASELPLARIASSIAWLPWTSRGGRAGLIAALASKGHDVTARSWWSGLDWQTLLDVGDGSVGSVLRQEEVKNAVTSRLLAEGLAGLTTRAALSQWIGAPRLVFELADPAHVGARIAQVVENDPLLTAAFATVRREHALSELRLRTERAENDSASASHRSDAAAQELAAVEGARKRLESELAAALAADRGVRTSERRQARLDGMKAAAQMLATATAESGVLDPEQLVARLVAIAGRAGVTPRGEIDAIIEFDPTWCEAPGMALGAGDRCVVVRPAYEFGSEQEHPVLLFKAVVRAD